MELNLLHAAVTQVHFFSILQLRKLDFGEAKWLSFFLTIISGPSDLGRDVCSISVSHWPGSPSTAAPLTHHRRRAELLGLGCTADHLGACNIPPEDGGSFHHSLSDNEAGRGQPRLRHSCEVSRMSCDGSGQTPSRRMRSSPKNTLPNIRGGSWEERTGVKRLSCQVEVKWSQSPVENETKLERPGFFCWLIPGVDLALYLVQIYVLLFFFLTTWIYFY